MSVYSGNTEADIERSLSSLVNQDYPSLEIVLTLDGPISSDLAAVISAADRLVPTVPIRRTIFKKRQGLGPALNAAIHASRGEYLARMDADDESLPDRISSQVKYLEEHADVDVVGCFIEEVTEHRTVHIASVPLTHEGCEKEFIKRDPVLHPTAMFRRRFFEKAGIYPPHICEDMALWLQAMKAGCRFANIPVAKYRMFLDDRFFLRRKNLRWIWWVFRMRLQIAREMEFGPQGYFWALARLSTMLLPQGLLKLAYRHRERFFRLWQPTR